MASPSSPSSEPPSPLSPPESPSEIDVFSSSSASSASGVPVARDFANSASPTPRLPSLRSASDNATAIMTSSSTPLGNVNAARRPVPLPASSTARVSALPSDMQAKMKAFHLSRQGVPPGQPSLKSPSTTGPVPPGSAVNSGLGGLQTTAPMSGALAGNPRGFRLPANTRPQALNANSAPAVPVARFNPKMSGGLAAKRGLNKGMKLSDASGPPLPSSATENKEAEKLQEVDAAKKPETLFNKYSEFVDTATGTLKFKGKATIHGSGIDFSSGSSFSISLDEVDTIDELGKGNYGTVYQVRHSRPRIRRAGMGLAGNKAPNSLQPSASMDSINSDLSQSKGQRNTTGMVMAMKEIRLELDEAKFAAIIMELDVLHRCISPFIVDFYGAFFQEGAVYICMEFMDGGSIDKLYGEGIPENVLRKIVLSTVMGLKSLKDDHNIIHRDVKPTNILVNSRGQVKICDFGVSGNLVASIAKTNIGCQSYMAPERIASGGVAQAGANPGGGTYSVQSDIWSLGLTIIECAMGRYPYPPETYNNIFSQLSAIVDGDPPDLPATGYSDQARDFVRSCLNKVAKLRPTYAMLIRHPWLTPLLQPPTISEDSEAEAAAESGDLPLSSPTAVEVGGDVSGMASTADPEVAAWAVDAIEKRRLGKLKRAQKPALHAAPLDAVGSPGPQAKQQQLEVAAGGD